MASFSFSEMSLQGIPSTAATIMYSLVMLRFETLVTLSFASMSPHCAVVSTFDLELKTGPSEVTVPSVPSP
ncbi:MAG: hypothetical protein QM784_18790 [Polyangiaceae bacterium]